MSEQDKDQAPGAEASKALAMLPAATLLLVLNLFTMQALMVPVGPATGSERHGLPHSSAHSSTELPVLGQVQPFALTERSGAPLTQATLAGKVWVADFIFTSCPAECPLMSAEMQKLQQAFAAHPDVRLLSFSVDPATDTPDRLRKYADKYGADPQRWLFATGRIENLYQLAATSFHLVPPGQPGPAPFLHTPRFALVDDRLQIRGYYDSTDPAALRSLIEKDLPQLLPH